MFESCRAHFRVGRTGDKVRIIRHLCTHVAERDAVHSARDATDVPAVEQQLVIRVHGAVDVEDTEPAVALAAVVLARDRLLTRVAALRETDVCLSETGFGRQESLVQLRAPPPDSRLAC